MPGVCPGGGGGMLKFRFDRRITADCQCCENESTDTNEAIICEMNLTETEYKFEPQYFHVFVVQLLRDK